MNPLVNTCVTLKIFTLKSGMYAVPVHVIGYNVPYLFWYPLQSPRSELVTVFLFPVLTTVFTYSRLVIFFWLFTICDVEPESATSICSISLLIVLFSHTSASYPKKSSSWYIYSFKLEFYFYFICHLFLLPEELFFVTLLVTVREFLSILLLHVELFNDASIFFAVHTVIIFFSIHTISNVVPIFNTVVSLSFHLMYI